MKFYWTLAFAAMLLTAGCSTKNDAIANAEKSEKNRASISETKEIAEEGFIYGLPLVMSYGIMNAYSINRSSGAFTAPLNHILNEPRVYTYKDTAIPLPNSDTPYSVLFMDLRAEPIVLSLPPVDKQRYYSVMLSDGNTKHFGKDINADGTSPRSLAIALSTRATG